MKLNIRPARSSSALHNERCNTLISELERRGVEPGIIQAFRKLVKSNSALRAFLRPELATNIALRGMLEGRGIVASDFVIEAEQSFEFVKPSDEHGGEG